MKTIVKTIAVTTALLAPVGAQAMTEEDIIHAGTVLHYASTECGLELSQGGNQILDLANTTIDRGFMVEAVLSAGQVEEDIEWMGTDEWCNAVLNAEPRAFQ